VPVELDEGVVTVKVVAESDPVNRDVETWSSSMTIVNC